MALTAIIPLDKESVILAGRDRFEPVRIPVGPSVLAQEEREEIVRCEPCEWYDEDNIEYESGSADSASKREYETFDAIRKAAMKIQDSAVVELRYHRGECDRCEKSKTVKSVRVKLRQGPFEFSREYACPQGEAS